MFPLDALKLLASGAATTATELGRRRGGEHPPVLLPAAAHAVEPDALLEHAHPQALLEAARLARLPPPLVDLAVVGRGARVLDVSWKQVRDSVVCTLYCVQ